MNEWKVLSNPVGGEMIYQVYQIRNPKEPMHAGNINTSGGLFDSEEEAQKHADTLNESMEEKAAVCALLLPALQATRNLHDLEALEYDEGKETVRARFAFGSKVINVAADSGTSMILDIILKIV